MKMKKSILMCCAALLINHASCMNTANVANGQSADKTIDLGKVAYLPRTIEEQIEIPQGVSSEVGSYIINHDSNLFMEFRRNPIHYIPIKQWSQFNLFINNQNQYYQTTWDESKTLQQNKDALYDAFFSKCINILPVQILKTKTEYVRIFDQQAINIVFRGILNLPLGCELMRIAIAKYKIAEGMGQPLGKLIICSTNGSIYRFLPITSLELQALFTDNKYNVCHTTELQYMFLIPINAPTKIYICAKKNDYIAKLGTMLFSVTEQSDPIQSYFHELVHWIHAITNYNKFTEDMRSHMVIEKRFIAKKMDQGVFINCLSDPGQVVWRPLQEIESRVIAHYTNDEEFRTQFGFMCNEDGVWMIDTLNDAAFAASRGMPIVCDHIDYMRHDLIDFLFHQAYGDIPMLHYYLGGAFKGPKFGEGSFKYSSDAK